MALATPGKPNFGNEAVERALLSHFAIDKNRKSAFLNRIRHFQRVGIAAPNVGSGRVASYSTDQILAYGFAMNLAELGLTPAAIRLIYDAVWPEVGLALDGPVAAGTLCFLSPALLSQEVIGTAPRTTGQFVVASEDLDVAGYHRAIVVNLFELKEGIVAALMPPRMPNSWS